MTHTTQTTARYVGIDVSQKTLTIALYPTDAVWTTDNTGEPHTALVQRLAHLPIQRVLLESAGGYEKAVVSALQQAGLPVVVVPAQRARYCAKSMRGEPTAPTRGCWRTLPDSRRFGRVKSSWCRRGSAKRSVCRPCSRRQCGRRWSGCLPSSKTRLPRLRRALQS